MLEQMIGKTGQKKEILEVSFCSKDYSWIDPIA